MEKALGLRSQVMRYVDWGFSTVTISVSSTGGDLDAALVLVDLLNELTAKGKVVARTVVVGRAASAATLVSMAGHKGHRYILPHSKMLLHRPRVVIGAPTQFKADELTVASEELHRVQDGMKELYLQMSTRSEALKARYDEVLQHDDWLHHEQCLDLGLVDHIGNPPEPTSDAPEPTPDARAPEQQPGGRVVFLPSNPVQPGPPERRVWIVEKAA